MRNCVGQPVRGDDFFDREEEQRRIWARLETNNLLLLAPRRVGKTSLMERLKADSGSHGYCTLSVDVSDAADESAFVRLGLLREYWQNKVAP